MSNHAPPAFDVYFIFQKQELKLAFNSTTHANAYHSLNREGRIFTHEPTAVYLPLSPAMTYLRDSSSGLVIGFTSPEDADTWCRNSILGHIYATEPSTEVRIRRTWTDEELDEVLRAQHHTNGFRNSVPLPLRAAMAPNTPPSHTGSKSRPTSGQFAPPPWAQVGSASASPSPPATSHHAYSPDLTQQPKSTYTHTAYRPSHAPSDSIQHPRASYPSVEVEHLDVPPLRVGHPAGGAPTAPVH
ncbi:hypothetical protein BO94DRAFT_538555 [Aspergillus sclerotioniger CBS 115572]|uniref:Uncharacterized protein n=1 Tax=Aspergillus sclerotioniger CBS 115572 TaxID=1450535 RepID=A0A317VPN6_9EURO|nr:hypothetical protein BO94DRAFT_538555 [Aspergillus sclerotioniger CBS 115572]PWY75231.1 hypothetical protein BO94DRAFT_538555 [Aspergillus sclerotioniger CBS 115572]